MLEAGLSEKLQDRIKERYGDDAWVKKINDRCQVGIPDILICLRGHFIAVETKRPDGKGNKGTPKQRYEMWKIRKAGGTAILDHRLEEIMSKLKELEVF